MEIFLLWIGLSVVAGVWASNKGRCGICFFFLSALLSPLIGLLAAGVARRNERALESQALRSGDLKTCPMCAELVRREAIKCRYCGADLSQPTGPETLPSSGAYQVGTRLGKAVADVVRGPSEAATEPSYDTPTIDQARVRRRNNIAIAVIVVVVVAGLFAMLFPGRLSQRPEPFSISRLPASGWLHVRTIGAFQMILVDKDRQRNKDMYFNALEMRCVRGVDLCRLLFWSDERLVPSKMPMTDAQAKAVLANFTVERNSKTILWSCHIDPASQDCFR